MTKATQRRKHLIVSLLIVSEGESMISSQGREHGSRQAGVVLEQQLSAYILRHTGGSGREGLG